MKNVLDFYVLGLPIETRVGNLSFIKVKDYPDCHENLNAIRMTKDHIVKIFYDNGMAKEDLDVLTKLSLFEMVQKIDDIRGFYVKMFELICDTEIDVDMLDEELFTEIRTIILNMCVIKEEKINPNPEIQAWIEKSKNFKADTSGTLDFADIVTSVAIGGGYSYEQINDLTIYQLYMSFYRIAQFKNYDTTTLFATVAEKVDIDSWNKNIDMLKEETHGMSKEEFDKMGGSIF